MRTEYNNCISITQALYFDLFDNISYKWLKLILDPSIDRDEWDFQVHIEDLDCEIQGYCITKFTFDLKISKITSSYNANGFTTEYKTKTFTKTIEYQCSSPFDIALCEMIITSDDDGSDYDEIEEEVEEEEEPTSVIDFDVPSLYPVVEIR